MDTLDSSSWHQPHSAPERFASTARCRPASKHTVEPSQAKRCKLHASKHSRNQQSGSPCTHTRSIHPTNMCLDLLLYHLSLLPFPKTKQGTPVLHNNHLITLSSGTQLFPDVSTTQSKPYGQECGIATYSVRASNQTKAQTSMFRRRAYAHQCLACVESVRAAITNLHSTTDHQHTKAAVSRRWLL